VITKGPDRSALSVDCGSFVVLALKIGEDLQEKSDEQEVCLSTPVGVS